MCVYVCIRKCREDDSEPNFHLSGWTRSSVSCIYIYMDICVDSFSNLIYPVDAIRFMYSFRC